MKKKKAFPVRRLTYDAMLAALYVALAYLTIPLGNVHVTLMTLPIAVCAFLFAPLDAALVGLIGEGIVQLIEYGPAPTMPLWMLAPALYGLVLGTFALIVRRAGDALERHTVLCVCATLASALFMTAVNTVALYVDSRLYGYFKVELFTVQFLSRALIGLATAVVVALVCRPLCRAVRPRGARQ